MWSDGFLCNWQRLVGERECAAFKEREDQDVCAEVLLSLLDRLWHCGMLAYLARDEVPNVNANALRILLGVFAPSLVNSISSFFFAAAIILGAALTFLPRWS